MQLEFAYDKNGAISNVTGHGKLQHDMEFTQGGKRFLVRAGADLIVAGAPGGSSTIKGNIHDLDGTKGVTAMRACYYGFSRKYHLCRRNGRVRICSEA
jgi:hypothetical protein